MVTAAQPRRRPLWLLWALGLLLFALLIRLGVWQLDRAAQKQLLFTAYEQPLTHAQPLDADATLEALRYSVVWVVGRYDPEHQFLLDGMHHEGRVGYHALTPLVRASGAPALLVNRGWLPAGADRGRLPALEVGGDERRLRGRIAPLPRPGMRLQAPPTGQDWPRVVLFPRGEDISAQLGYEVLDYQLLLDDAAPDGYTRAWGPPEFGPERHVAYALQWFAFAATLVGMTVYALYRGRRRPTEDGDAG